MVLTPAQVKISRIVKCIKCGHGIRTTRRVGYLFCYQCGGFTRLQERTYKARNTYKEYNEKIDEAWVFRD